MSKIYCNYNVRTKKTTTTGYTEKMLYNFYTPQVGDLLYAYLFAFPPLLPLLLPPLRRALVAPPPPDSWFVGLDREGMSRGIGYNAGDRVGKLARGTAGGTAGGERRSRLSNALADRPLITRVAAPTKR